MAKIKIKKGSSVSSTPSGRPLFTDTRLGSIGSGIKDLGNVLTGETVKALEKRNKILEQDYVNNSLIETSEQATRLQQEMVETRKDPKGFADDFIEEYDVLTNEQIENAPSENAKAKLKNIYTQNRINNFKNAFNTENSLIADDILARSQANIDLISEGVFNDPSLLEANLRKLDLISESVDPILDEQNLAKFNNQAKLKIADRYISGMMNTDVDKAIRISESKKFKQLVGSRLASSYHESAKTQKQRINNEATRQRSEQKQSVKTDRQIGIFKGKITQAQLDKDLQEGLYDKGEYLSLSKELKNTLKSESSIATSVENVRSKLELNQPFDTSNAKVRKDLNRYFDNVVEPTLTSENYDQSISSFINDTSFIPDKVKSVLVAGLHNGSDEEIVLNANRIESLTRSNPQLTRQFTATTDLARSKLISSSVNAGMPTVDAIKAADNMIVEKNSVLQKQREKDFKKTNINFDVDEVQTFFRNDPSDTPEALKEDWRSLYENYAVNLKMPLDQARDLAYQIVNSEWGVSNVTGEPTYIKHAPEKYYNTKNLDPEWIEQDLKKDVSEILPEVEDYDLSVDPDTIGSEQPGYLINYVTEHGIPVLLRDNNKNLLVWRPDINTSGNAKKQMEKRDVIFNKDREKVIESQIEADRVFTNIGGGIL